MTRTLSYLSDASLDVLLSRGLAVARRHGVGIMPAGWVAPPGPWPDWVQVVYELVNEYIERHRSDRQRR